MTVTEARKAFRIKIGDYPYDENGVYDPTATLYTDEEIDNFLNEAILDVNGYGWNVNNSDFINYNKLANYAEFLYYYRLARDTAFYAKYQEAQGDEVDKRQTPELFLKLAMQKEKMYYSKYGSNVNGSISLGGNVGGLFSFA